MNSYVYALALSGTDLYAGGWFTTAGGVPANYVAKWNGSAWSPLDSGMSGITFGVKALAMSGTNLYAGGYSTVVGGVAANYVAKWDGSAWSVLGSGMGGISSTSYPPYPYVSALAVDGAGHLFAGGYFTTAGGVPANYIAEWDGSAWSAVGSGMNDQVSALAVDGTGHLFAGGYFTNAGGVPANYVARWDGGSWWTLGSGMSGQVSTLAADEMGHLFVGGSFYRAGTNASFYIAQANLGNAPTSAPPVILVSPASMTVPLWGTADFQVEALRFAAPGLSMVLQRYECDCGRYERTSEPDERPVHSSGCLQRDRQQSLRRGDQRAGPAHGDWRAASHRRFPCEPGRCEWRHG